MSKLNVNELEANGTNSNLKVVSKGTTGVCEVTGADNNATLQLNCSAQSHGVKLKAPADSAGQNYTLALPDNQIAAGKLLQLKTVTGSGATAEGQLEFADAPPAVYTNLNATNITSGTLDNARLNSTPASAGGGFKFVSKTELTGAQTASKVSFTGLDDDGHYLIKGKDIQLSGATYLYGYFLGSDGTKIKDSNNNPYTYAWQRINGLYNYVNESYASYSYLPFQSSYNVDHYSFEMELFTGAEKNCLFFRAHHIERQSGTWYPTHFSMNAQLYQPATGTRIHGFEFEVVNSSYTFMAPTEIMLYQFLE